MKVDERDMRHLRSIVTKNLFLSFDAVKHELEKLGVNVCRATVIEYLRSMGFNSYYAKKKPTLTVQHKKRRLEWAQKHVNWTTDQWASVIWSDVSRYEIEGHRGGLRVIRQQGQAYKEELTVPTKKFGKGSVMLWSCFLRGGARSLVFVDDSVHSERYIQILAMALGSSSQGRQDRPLSRRWRYVPYLCCYSCLEDKTHDQWI